MNKLLQTPPVPEASRAEHLELILEMSAIGVWELDVISGAAWRSEQHDRIFGYDHLLPEWTYDQFMGHVLPEDREMVDARYGGALQASVPWSFECRIHRADGEVRWISATGRPIKGEDGQTVRLIGHVLDVTHVKRGEEHLRVLIDELNHRVRNTLAVVQAIAMRSFRDDVDPAQGRSDFVARINALAAAHSLLSERSWTEAHLGDVAEKALFPFQKSGDADTPPRISFTGPDIRLSAKQSLSLSMALNELATNATKHGSLSVPGGRVDLSWALVRSEEVDDTQRSPERRVDLIWRELGGPRVERGSRSGFGMTLLEKLTPGEIGGEVEVEFQPGGLVCSIRFPRLSVLPESLVAN